MTRFFPHPIPLQYKVSILGTLLVVASLLISGFLVWQTIIVPLEEQAVEQAMVIAKLFASLPEVRNNINDPGGSGAIQLLAEEYREETGVLSITVVDMEGIRYSHVLPERIGELFEGEGLEEVLKGENVISRFFGSLGYQIRTFTPIMHGITQIGAVGVSLLANDIHRIQQAFLKKLIFALILGLLLGIVGGSVLAKNIKKSIAGLEPHEIFRISKEREGILESVREGIIAIDDMGRITLINHSARAILKLKPNLKGCLLREIVPNMQLLHVLQTGKAVFDLEQKVGDVQILTNQVPIEVKGAYVGAIASFREMTEVTLMAEELTEVKRYVEALRVYNHEFLNKLHTIAGLIHLGKSDQALKAISESTETLQGVMSLITKRIKNPSVGGLLLGKIGQCRELGIRLEIDPTSYLGSVGNLGSNALVTVLGNLLENAISSVIQSGKEERYIRCALFDQSGTILVSVRDEGCGISPEIMEKIFQKGFSTKQGNGGYGLFKVQQIVSLHGGEVEVHSQKGEYAEFFVTLPTTSDWGEKGNG